MTLSVQEQMLIEQRVTNEAKSPTVAYLLWFFLGVFSAHRFYLGKPGTAILQIISYVIVVGVIWWIIDAFLISGMIQEHNAAVRARHTLELMNRRPPDVPLR